jgi:hypothetical protein
LVKLFSESPLWDGPVLLGREKLPARLIAVRLPQALAAERRRKARANRDQRLHHSPQYLRLLDWNIFITNVPAATAPAHLLVKLYALRWRIEIIFKTWKSHFHLDQPLNGPPAQILLVILGKLIWITWFSVHFTQALAKQENISLLKLADWWSKFGLLAFLPTLPTGQNLWKLILYYSRYEQRKDRVNFLQKLASLG